MRNDPFSGHCSCSRGCVPILLRAPHISTASFVLLLLNLCLENKAIPSLEPDIPPRLSLPYRYIKPPQLANTPCLPISIASEHTPLP